MVVTDARTSTAPSAALSRFLVTGAVAGAAAAVPMAAYAMIAAWVKDTGFFTPLHHIASLWASPSNMMASMEEAAAGSAFHLEAWPALLGVGIHLATGALYGLAFALVVYRLALSKPALVAAGLVWGALVFAFSSFIGLPIAAALFDSGDPIKNMAEMAGWGTFVIEHLVYGVVLGALVALRPAAVHRVTGAVPRP